MNLRELLKRNMKDQETNKSKLVTRTVSVILGNNLTKNFRGPVKENKKQYYNHNYNICKDTENGNMEKQWKSPQRYATQKEVATVKDLTFKQYSSIQHLVEDSPKYYQGKPLPPKNTRIIIQIN